ncbi:MAG: pirin family protein [Gammaproteobacteria bacterium]
MAERTLRALHPATRDDIGDLRTQRPVPNARISQIDPFLFLNHHGPQRYGPGNHGLPFGPHPHRGFETVTFILEGELAHQDSAGHESIIRAGGIQWMTAGSGIVHAEVSPRAFLEHGGPLEILQLWVNLPSHLKMSPPAYTGLQRDAIPALSLDDGKVTLNLVAGQFGTQRGPVETLLDIFMSTLDMRAGGRLHVDGLAGRNVLLYVVKGELRVAGATVPALQLCELNDDGDALDMRASADSVVLFGHARPLGEPVVAHGPFVMNTRAEITQAILDYQAGRFGAPMQR